MNIATFSSFKSRNFRLFFIGQSTSLIGTWMQKTAVSWVIYSLTNSKFMLGLSVFATLFPTAIFSLFGGIVADRYNRFKVLLVTQLLSMLQAIFLTLAVIFMAQDLVWMIILLSVLLGIINGYDGPVRQALVREMVNRQEDLPNALALNSSMVNLSKMIGPTIAGFILHAFGEQVCFGLNAASFIAVIGCLFLMKLPKNETRPADTPRLKDELIAMYRYVSKTPTLSSVIIFTTVTSFFVLPFTTLTPVFARDIFNGDASTLGFIDGFIGLGAFAGALFLASLNPGLNLNKILAINTFTFGIGLMMFSFSTTLSLALVFITIGAFGMMAIRTVSNTIIQLNVNEEFRGRTISLFIMSLTAMVPLGSLLVSGVSHYIGVQKTVFAEGVIAIIISIFYARYLRREKLRQKRYRNP